MTDYRVYECPRCKNFTWDYDGDKDNGYCSAYEDRVIDGIYNLFNSPRRECEKYEKGKPKNTLKGGKAPQGAPEWGKKPPPRTKRRSRKAPSENGKGAAKIC